MHSIQKYQYLNLINKEFIFKNQPAGVTSVAYKSEVTILHAGKQTCIQGIHPGFETQDRHHQKSETRVSVAPQKGLISSEIKQKTSQVWVWKFKHYSEDAYSHHTKK